MKTLKLCNIKNIYETRTLARFGADYLGYHLISDNDFKRIDEIRACINELKMSYSLTKSVLVTKETDIEKLKTTIKENEFNAVQLHRTNAISLIAQLRSIFGSKLEIFQVVTIESEELSPLADMYLLDKSFLGGTGKEIGLADVQNYINKHKKSNILLAGGISHHNIDKYLHLNIQGFDIQSGIKSTTTHSNDNTDPIKALKITEALNKKKVIPLYQIGYAVQNINQQNGDTLHQAINAKIDFLHIDISDGFVNSHTHLSRTEDLINSVRGISAHIPIQLHIFASNYDSYLNMIHELNVNEDINIKIIVHINRDNVHNYNQTFLNDSKNLFGLDVKDLIDDHFQWEEFIKDETLICLQSKEHEKRVENFNLAQKIINVTRSDIGSVTIDRSVDFETISKISDLSNVNIVSGSYLKEDIPHKYKLLKNYFYARQ